MLTLFGYLIRCMSVFLIRFLNGPPFLRALLCYAIHRNDNEKKRKHFPFVSLINQRAVMLSKLSGILIISRFQLQTINISIM